MMSYSRRLMPRSSASFSAASSAVTLKPTISVSSGLVERQVHVALGDGADAGVQHAGADLLVVELLEFLADRLDRAAGLGLEDHLQLGDLGLGAWLP